MLTAKDVLAARLHFIRILADSVKEAGRIPSGHLYAAVMGIATLEAYQSCVETLKRSGLIKEVNHELIWVG